MSTKYGLDVCVNTSMYFHPTSRVPDSTARTKCRRAYFFLGGVVDVVLLSSAALLLVVQDSDDDDDTSLTNAYVCLVVRVHSLAMGPLGFSE